MGFRLFWQTAVDRTQAKTPPPPPLPQPSICPDRPFCLPSQGNDGRDKHGRLLCISPEGVRANPAEDTHYHPLPLLHPPACIIPVSEGSGGATPRFSFSLGVSSSGSWQPVTLCPATGPRHGPQSWIAVPRFRCASLPLRHC